MEIKYFDGDVLTSTAPIIMHQVNCQGTMRSGVAKAISEKWPIVEEKYKNFCKALSSKGLLGLTQVVKVNDNQYVANLFGQETYGYSGKKYTSYDAIDNALRILLKKMESNSINRLAMPYKMSSDRGGADWDVILAIITSIFKDSDITIEIWKL